MAKYVLNLNKTKMYGLISEYRQDLPKMCRCEYGRHGTIYRMEYNSTNENYGRIRVDVMTLLGYTTIRVIDMSDDVVIFRDYLTFQFLLDHGLLREVA